MQCTAGAADGTRWGHPSASDACVLRFTAHSCAPLQLTYKDKEAEFWRIVEDGEDVVEVGLAHCIALICCCH